MSAAKKALRTTVQIEYERPTGCFNIKAESRPRLWNTDEIEQIGVVDTKPANKQVPKTAQSEATTTVQKTKARLSAKLSAQTITLIANNTGNVFYVGKQIGFGGYSRCYIAHDQDGNKVAAKVIPIGHNRGRSSLLQAKQEVSLHQTLSHPFIVRFFDIIQTETYITMVLDYCPNKTLRELIAKRGRLQESEACRMMKPIISAVNYLHSHLIHHGDLKLSNIFLDSNMMPKIGDFGFAAQLQPDNRLRQNFCGTPSYMAPEIIEAPSRFGLPADIWALGVITYALLYGITPFEAGDVKSVYQRILTYDLKFPQTTQLLSMDAVTCILAMLRRVPEDRPTSTMVLEDPWVLKYSCPFFKGLPNERGSWLDTAIKSEPHMSRPGVRFARMCRNVCVKSTIARKLRQIKSRCGN